MAHELGDVEGVVLDVELALGDGMSRALCQSVMNTSQSGSREITVLRRSVA
jgi:hypothetical protein